MLKRRSFFNVAAAAIPFAASGRALAQNALGIDSDMSLTAQRGGSNACLPDWGKVKTRTAPKTEIVYKAPRGRPNGLGLGNKPGEMWVIDQSQNWVSLIRLEDGSVIHEFQVDVSAASGLVVDDDNMMWIGSTHNSLIVKVDPTNGKTIAKYFTPGSGHKYTKRGDPPGRTSKLPLAYPERKSNGVPDEADKFIGPGQVPLDTEVYNNGITGALGMVVKGDLLIYACTTIRSLTVLNKKTWEVQATWPTPGDRPHGTTWADQNKNFVWNADSNLNAFYRFNATTGQIVEKVALQDEPHAVIHGAKLVLEGYGAGHMYFCDDTGWICRVKWT